MKIKELQKVSSDKIGRVDKNNVDIEPHEDSTILYLAQYGFDIEMVKPTNAYKTNSAECLFFVSEYDKIIGNGGDLALH